MYRTDHFKPAPELQPIRGPRWQRARAERTARKEIESDIFWLWDDEDDES